MIIRCMYMGAIVRSGDSLGEKVVLRLIEKIKGRSPEIYEWTTSSV
jgi:hypothetical protein